MNLEWTVQDETVRSMPSGFRTVTTRNYRMPDGTVSAWDLVDDGESVAVLALTPDHRVVLARQFRPGPGKILLEMPGGRVDHAENVIVAGQRELREETGYGGSNAEYVGSTWQSSTSRLQQHVIIVRDAVELGAPTLDTEEFIETVTVTLTEFRNLLASGELTDQGLGYRALEHLNAAQQ
ncbi:NUDIX hydrolase [Haematomicrobium sanguinis]|uniref:NUDIX hydrolase n=1 Tax=Haematomicrobium sanguinis TaxID=479106 RepID=UPI00146FB08E|nr:NUDIX hydrolase [Haematomicrobium sanguinis]